MFYAETPKNESKNYRNKNKITEELKYINTVSTKISEEEEENNFEIAQEKKKTRLIKLTKTQKMLITLKGKIIMKVFNYQK